MIEKRCIYCSPKQPAQAPHTVEHVVPEAFGKFKNNLTLHEGVCSECNQFFGNNHDLFLGRGCAEAIKRLDYQIKPPKEASDILRDRVNFTLSNDNAFDGLRLEYGCEQGEIVLLPIAQVGFPRIDGTGWVFVTERELADISNPLPEGIDTNTRNVLVFNSDETKQKLNKLLKERKIDTQEISEEGLSPTQTGEEAWVKVTSILDDMILRAIAKIAFNYLAKVGGIDFAAHTDFDLIRSYIRDGQDPGYQAVQVSQQPILKLDSASIRQTIGHLLTLDWSSHGQSMIVQVSLFNFTTYKVIMARNFSGVWRPIQSGHHFNIEKLEVLPLQGLSGLLLP